MPLPSGAGERRHSRSGTGLRASAESGLDLQWCEWSWLLLSGRLVPLCSLSVSIEHFSNLAMAVLCRRTGAAYFVPSVPASRPCPGGSANRVHSFRGATRIEPGRHV